MPRNDNERADALSRIVDYDDWSINPSVFKWLDSIWGPHTVVDRFATDFNAQIERFNSRFWCGNTEAVDAFTVNWAGENNWWCPPVSLIGRVLQHAKVCSTLVIPFWVSAAFWPMICPQGDGFAGFVHGAIQLPGSIDNLIVPGKRGATLDIKNSHMLALRISFR